ncbi:MAG: sigma-70 family RNA polymerase sigma factor [Pirellulaceae bacterium]|nr:sigma-70 family RNA polymerase sigma factor [Pirellulaceae bacterium]
MADATIDEDDDEPLNFRIQCQEPAALARLLELYGPTARGYLKKRYGHVLCDADIMSVLTNTAARVWQYGDSYDPKQSLKSWFLRIVQTQAIDMINDNMEHRGVALDLQRHDRPEVCDEPLDKKTRQQIEALDRCIEKLVGNQKAIIQADLASDDSASTEWLAEKLGTTSNSIYVSRIKARENLRKCLSDHENQIRSNGARK